MRRISVIALVCSMLATGCGTKKTTEDTAASVYEEFQINSSAIGADRTVGVYLPKGYSGKTTYPVVYMEDGLVFSTGNYCHLMDSLIDNNIINPVVVVCSYEDQTRIHGFDLTMRNAEYLETVAMQAPELKDIFDRHLNYFVNELIPAAEKRYSISAECGGRVYYGTSNSADFGLTVSMIHSELFHEYWCFSPVCSDISTHGMLETPVAYKICWGAKEETGMSFDYFPNLIQSIRKRGGSVTNWTYPGGHERPIWEKEFVKLMSAKFAKK